MTPTYRLMFYREQTASWDRNKRLNNAFLHFSSVLCIVIKGRTRVERRRAHESGFQKKETCELIFKPDSLLKCCNCLKDM